MSARTLRLSTRATPVVDWLQRETGITTQGLSIAGASALGWLLAYNRGAKALYLMAYAGALLLVVATFLARRSRGVRAIRSDVPHRVVEGQRVDVRVELEAKRRVTTFLLEETLPANLGKPFRMPVSAISAGDSASFGYSFTPALRGVYKLGPLKAEFADPLGVSRWGQTLLDEVEVIVHPTVEPLLDRPLTRALEEPPLRPPRSRAWPEGFDFYGMREYVRGDDVRRIVWTAFARTEKLLVREFEQGVNDRIVILLDSDTHQHSGGEVSATFETGVKVAASVGLRHIQNGFTVSLNVNGEQLVKPARGPRARYEYLDQLARCNRGSEPLTDALFRLAKGRRDFHLVLITSHLSYEAAARLSSLIDKGASVVVVAIEWEESDGSTLRRAREVGAQVVKIKPGAALAGVFKASLTSNLNSRAHST
jgi:uncharacterized protein (DUF58 family)